MSVKNHEREQLREIITKEVRSPIAFYTEWRERHFIVTQDTSGLQAALLAERTRNAELSGENAKLWDYLVSAIAEKKALLGIALARQDTRICLCEVHGGIVTEVSESSIVISYQTHAGENLEQVYSLDQFNVGVRPVVGDVVEAHVFISNAPTENEMPSDSELESAFSGYNLGKTGTFEI